MSFLVIDIETRIDKALLNATNYAGQGLDDETAYRRMRADLEQDGGSGFFPISFHVPISIAIGWVDDCWLLRRVEVSRADERGEEEIVRAFWDRLETFDGGIVTFNGRRFDLPVLELQALRYGISAPRYFNERFGMRGRSPRHDDLWEFMSNFGALRLSGGFDLLAKLIGLPGKRGVVGADVQGLWEAGRYDEIHRYCREDVIQTYFLFLRIEHLRGHLSRDGLRYAEEATMQFRHELESPPSAVATAARRG